MKVEIDPNSGFCFGVVNAIRKAEEELSKGPLYCIGDIVHNGHEMNRLENLGLRTIDHDAFVALRDCRVLFRAHGEPPSSYQLAREHRIEVIDASCPVVLKLQEKIREAYKRIKEIDGQVVIYGKLGHAEVKGLVAQINGDAIIVENPKDLEEIDFARPVVLFSQTTQSLEGFRQIVEQISERSCSELKPEIHDTICRKVANRIPELKRFAAEHDVIFFVSGRKSANGMQLYMVCKEVNPNTWFVEGTEDLHRDMLAGAKSVGISGATSTPFWVMERVLEWIRKSE